MNHRHQKGMRWFKHVMLLAGSFAAFKFVFAFLGPNAGGKAAEAVAILIGSVAILGLPAYILGWLTEKEGGAEAPAKPPASLQQSKTSIPPPANTPVFDEDRAYQNALEELNDNQTHPRSGREQSQNRMGWRQRPARCISDFVLSA